MSSFRPLQLRTNAVENQFALNNLHGQEMFCDAETQKAWEWNGKADPDTNNS